MGQGIDLARVDAPAHAEAMENMRDQLVLALVDRLGGDVSMSVDEIDRTGRWVLLMCLRDGVFQFRLRAKS